MVRSLSAHDELSLSEGVKTDADAAGDLAAVGLEATGHPLIGAAASLPDGGRLFSGRLSVETLAWLDDHRLHGTVALPGVGFVELALAAGRHLGLELLHELAITAPLLWADERPLLVRVHVDPDEDGERQVVISAAVDDGDEPTWTRHATGVIGDGDAQSSEREPAELDRLGGPWPPPGATAIDVDALYEGLIAAGYGFGPQFQGLVGLWHRGEEWFSELELAVGDDRHAGDYMLHPALFDSVLHMIAAAEPAPDTRLHVPFAFSGVTISQPGRRMLRTRVTRGERGKLTVDLADERGSPVGRVDSLALRPIEREQLDLVPATADTPVSEDGARPEASGSLGGDEVSRIEREKGQLARRLADLRTAERRGTLINALRQEVAAVLGGDQPPPMSSDTAFKDLGLDSLTAIELRIRLEHSLDMRLPTTVVFDHPTLGAIADHILDRLNLRLPPARNGRADEEAALRRVLDRVSVAQLRQAGLLEPLLALDRSPDGDDGDHDAIATMERDELVRKALGDTPVA